MTSGDYLILESEGKKRCTIRRVACIFLIVLVTLLLLAFIGAFVVVPIVFKLSFGFQNAVMFTRFGLQSDPKYFNISGYGIKNFYVPVHDIEGSGEIWLGTWHLLPWTLVNASLENPDFDFDDALANSGHGVIIHFHGTGETRRDSYGMHDVLREFFHVIAFDYRGYGDSDRGRMSETAVVNDCIQFVKWIRRKTNSTLYVWGHSLGTSLSTSSVAALKYENIKPAGVFLEAPFTTMREEIPFNPYGKIFAWLPWFTATILDPLEANGFYFNNMDNILNVDCPIMIFHAEDDSVVPYKLGKKLWNWAKSLRSPLQGNVTYRQVPASYKCDHFWLYTYPYLMQDISWFTRKKNKWGT